MNGREMLSDRDKALIELRNDETIGSHSENLVNVFKGDSIQLAQYSLLLLLNQILTRNEELTILAVLCHISIENGFNSHLSLAWDFVKQIQRENSIVLMNHLLLEKGFLKVK